ncbi:hypothetical protein GRF29_19g3113007 [Pseudopithomyces chartarum]|uniref:tRNA pseudouridine(55) synthase n=1 Tax=Pseudopithomyces chartarum TaxID=1892770 RepID=A0AAN6M414_9PLEO|nr:hypothetical protein GRF29_19g3113007 [Pseudopithomyces chartarum]
MAEEKAVEAHETAGANNEVLEGIFATEHLGPGNPRSRAPTYTHLHPSTPSKQPKLTPPSHLQAHEHLFRHPPPNPAIHFPNLHPLRPLLAHTHATRIANAQSNPQNPSSTTSTGTPEAKARPPPRPFHMGHAGTLDPLATGILLLALGRATKSLPSYLSGSKTYETVVLFGVATDSYDVTGSSAAVLWVESWGEEGGGVGEGWGRGTGGVGGEGGGG